MASDSGETYAYDICKALARRFEFNVILCLTETGESSPAYAAVYLVNRQGREEVLKIYYGSNIEQEVSIVRSLHGKVPVPEIYDYGYTGNFAFMFMEYITDCLTLDDYDHDPSENFYDELACHWKIIRSHEMDTTGFIMEDALTHAFGGDVVAYESIDQFMNNRLATFGRSVSGLAEHKLVLSHCDIMPRNMLISPDGNHVRGIIDWEFAGYYPDFYEFFKYLSQLKMEHRPPSRHAEKVLDMFRVEWEDEIEEIEFYIHRQRRQRNNRDGVRCADLLDSDEEACIDNLFAL